jgi:hypothetical protein
MGEIPSAEETEWLEALDNVDFRPTGFRLEWMKDSHDDLEAASEVLLSIIREVKPDLLHFSQFYFGALQCEIPRIVVAHSDVISWWRSVHGVEPKNDEWITWYRGIVSNGLESATAVVAPSGWMLTALEQNYTR